MIITKTPFRVSFFGGGTDYPEYFRENGGAVLGTAIDKYAYFSVSQFYSKLFDYTIRIAYRQVECVKDIEELEHAPFRECLKWCGLTSDVEVDYTAELPSFSGLGTSSTFVVGLLNSLYAYQGRSIKPIELAYQAVEIERNVLKDCVGCQDQVFAALGGFNYVDFRDTRDIVVKRVPMSYKRMKEFEQHLLLVFTGIRRRAGEVAKKQVEKVKDNSARLRRMREMVDEGYEILTDSGSLEPFGKLLHEAWCLKSQLDSGVSNSTIMDIYNAGIDAGALGGKLLGAGGGGFILFFVPPEKRKSVEDRLKSLQIVPIGINAPGSHIVHS